MVKPVATIHVVPNLPDSLQRLQELAYNLRWAWDHETLTLFRRLDPDLWETSGHNPVWMLGLISQERLELATEDAAFHAHLNRVLSEFDQYLNSEDTWFQQNYGHETTPTIAYFSMEFGLTECLQNYSGGLGVLSGDHLKSASDLGVPLVGVGLLYQEGYFQQYLNADGFQQENYPINDYPNLPVTLQRDGDRQPIKISVLIAGRPLYAQIWKVQVGRVPLYLLDTNIADNERPEDRNLTDRLYGGDRGTRIRQEILMGIGGIRALEALGLQPGICHMNEGHSAFLALERIRQLIVERGLSFSQAREVTAASNIFTTHTPVPAGLERFTFELVDEHFNDFYPELGLTRDEFLDLGREQIGDGELFSMAVLALNLSSAANGVAKLHGIVSRRMWRWVFPGIPESEVPIESITNGIHIQTWLSREMSTLLDRYLDPSWRDGEDHPEVWEQIDHIPDTELWRTHERRRERLVAFTRHRLHRQLIARGASQGEIDASADVLDPDALTIGFARRFATYKRSTLLFRDIERLKAIVNNPERPVQFIFAGKAHPHDTAGKELIRQIVKMGRTHDFRHSLVFIENYDMNVARYLVQGVDVWLNNPRRPKEASGTSGMKVVYNGGLNCSILDGWWAEAYNPSVGWAIGNGEEYPDHDAELQDDIESRALYNLLEQDLVPLFYERGRDNVPQEWLDRVKSSMRTLSPMFNTRRMVREYTEQYYMPSYDRARRIHDGDLNNGRNYAAWRSNLEAVWPQVKVVQVDVAEQQITVGSEVEVHATIDLGSLTPEDVRVELYYGQLNTHGEIEGSAITQEMQLQDTHDAAGTYIYAGRFTDQTTGGRGVSVRVLPHHEFLPNPFQLGLITWA